MAVTTQEKFIVRPATMSDLEAAVEMFNLYALAQTGREDANPSEIEAEWTSPDFNLEECTRLVLTPEGKVVGYMEVWDTVPVPVRIWIWGRVHPDYNGQGIGTRLMDWAENRAQSAIQRAPAEAQVVLECGTIDSNQEAQTLFSERGLEVSRQFYQMRIDMDEAPPAPQWPEGIRIKVHTRPNDDDRAILAADDAFKDHWGHIDLPAETVLSRWKHHMDTEPDFDPSLWFLALDGDEVAGVSLCWPKEGNDPSIGYVGTLGVRRPWRRRGLARALLLHSFGIFWNRGQKSVMLGVDASSLTGATKLYEQAGMRVYHRFIVYRKVLRDGVDITTNEVNA